jgi:aldose 1-epimerase
VSFAPSGRQFEISRGEQRATVVEVGGGIREYAVGDRDVLEPYPLGAMCDGAHGAPLIPWPNRVADGRYSYDGGDFQLALTEPPRRNAIHGLLRWRPWEALEQDPDRVTVQARLLPMSGYPFALDLRITYELGEAGLTVSTSATNLGERPCPYGAGQHPYLSPGSGRVDRCTLALPAATRIVTDERMIPTGRTPVQETPFDFREPRPIGDLTLDVALTDLARDGDGLARARLTGADGHSVELWADAHYEFLEVFTGDTLAPERRRGGLGVEPMTCAPNAFQSGEGLLRLQPGETITTRWGVGLIDAAA